MLDERYARQVKIASGFPEAVTLAIDDILSLIPAKLSLDGNYPNPFNPVTTIRFGLPEPRRVQLSIVNILGQEVITLLNDWQDLGTLYALPEDQVLGEDVGGGQRYVTEARFRVYLGRNSGHDWEPLSRRLSQQNAYRHPMREGMATDSLNPCGIYIGTTSGQLFYSCDIGDDWELPVDYLPPINSVDCALVV